VTVDGTIINNLRGSGLDTGGSAVGIRSVCAGDYTVSHSIIRNVTNVAAQGIGIIDIILGPHPTGILIHANTILNVTEASNGIAVFGGNGATVSWNNISQVDGSSSGIMVDSTADNPLICNNSVTNLYHAPNIWPDWQIVVGAYAYYAGGSTEMPRFFDNHATGATATMPSYGITGEILGGGYASNTRVLISTSDSAVIRVVNGNVTLRHDSQISLVTKDGISGRMTYYANGSSYAQFPKTDLAAHYINISLLSATVTTDASVGITVSLWNPLGITAFDGTIEASPGTHITLKVTSLLTNTIYAIYINAQPVGMRGTGPSGSLSLSYSGPLSSYSLVLVRFQRPPSRPAPRIV
jgi:hypothetical protein